VIESANGSGKDGQTNRLAAIDVGTNSIRLIVVETARDGGYRILDDEKELARLGQGLSATGRLSAEAMQRAALAISRMHGIARGYGVAETRAIATCAVREAVNGGDFVRLVEREAGMPLEVVSAEDEARLAHRSAAHAFDLASCKAAVVDIGGGSTEIVLASSGVIERMWSLPLGAVRLTEAFPGVEGPSGDAAFEAMMRHIRRTMKRALTDIPFVPQVMIGTGGTFTTLAAIDAHRESGSSGGGMLPYNLRGYELQRSVIRHTLERLRKLTPRERLRVPGLSPDRADIIVAGCAIVDAALKRLALNTLRVHDRGIRDGLILTMIDQRLPSRARRAIKPLDRWEGVRRFAQACRFEEHHADHVAGLACQIFDQMSRHCPRFARSYAGAEGRDLLRAAALLHDVGYFINYSKHHKHSYHLIIHSELAGFSHRQVEIIANIARYHRRTTPKKRHPNFAKLAREDRDLVRVLSAILRLSVGLDRSHRQNVGRVDIGIVDGVCVFAVEAPEEPTVDLWGAERKAGPFEDATGLRTRFVWAKPLGAGSSRSAGRFSEPEIGTDTGALR